MHLPANNCAILSATDATMVPIAKISRAANRTDFRPIICENEAQVGLSVSGELAITSSGRNLELLLLRHVSRENRVEGE
jgi:hypothetical protein